MILFQFAHIYSRIQHWVRPGVHNLRPSIKIYEAVHMQLRV